MKKILSLFLTVSLLASCAGAPGEATLSETELSSPSETELLSSSETKASASLTGSEAPLSETKATTAVSATTTTLAGNSAFPQAIPAMATAEETVETTAEATEPRYALPDPPALEDFDRAVGEIAERYATTGLSLCVFSGGEIVHSVYLGYADKEADIPSDQETLYRVASVSKLVSAIVLMTLVDEGAIDLNDDLEELTGLPYNFPGSTDRVLLWHLLSHTAGLTDSYIYEELATTSYFSAPYVLESGYLYAAPGTVYNYSNFGAGTIGAVVERLTGEFFHDYADRALFAPLGMNAAYCADRLKDRQKCATLYLAGEINFDPKTWGRLSAYYERFGLGNSYLAAQCELLISAADLARLGIVLAGDGRVDGVEILSRAAVNAINTPYFDAPAYRQGLITRIYPDTIVAGRTIYGHPGYALGNVNGLYYDPSDGTGVALCTNGCYAAVKPNGVYSILDESIKLVYESFFAEGQDE
ncbi:MAG: beta-lactamase family protein [Bacteroides sp.]|nr:beta-lactamase family protein [Eubacterium sp.]MCM1417772.1 beta-lactamase family protein [Roseburia sp.]MCM1461337.1 beta-lactamase family protein [Bacteroides sp.]